MESVNYNYQEKLEVYHVFPDSQFWGMHWDYIYSDHYTFTDWNKRITIIFLQLCSYLITNRIFLLREAVAVFIEAKGPLISVERICIGEEKNIFLNINLKITCYLISLFK